MGLLDDIEITDCPECGRTITASATTLGRGSQTLRCPVGHEVQLEISTEDAKKARDSQAALDSLDRTLRNFGKGR